MRRYYGVGVVPPIVVRFFRAGTQKIDIMYPLRLEVFMSDIQRIGSQKPRSLSITFTYEDYGRPRVQGEPVGCIVVESRTPTHPPSDNYLSCRNFIQINHQSPVPDADFAKQLIWEQAVAIIDHLVGNS